MTTFEKNLELIGRYARVIPFFLRDVAADREFQPETDADEWFASLALEGVNVIYCFGIGTGSYYHAARAWLRADDNRYLVFLDDNLSIVRRFCESEAATEILSDRRVRFRLVSEPNMGDELLQIAIDTYATLPSTYTANQRYREGRADFSAQLESAVRTMARAANTAAFHATDVNASFYALLYPALRKLVGSYHGSALFGKFNGIPAIIAGAGPSLNPQIPLLRDLQDRALIFAGGSGFTALTRAGVEPHFGAGMSPGEDEIDRFFQARGYETPFFWKFRLHPEALDMIHGPLLYQSSDERTGVTSWIEQELGIPPAPTLFEGPSITYYLTCLVHLLGCDPILYVGTDFALTGDQAYAGTVDHDLDFEGVLATDIHGKPTRTLYKWLGERHSLAQVIAERAPTRYINCTDGGLGIDGVPNMPLHQAAEDFLHEARDLRGLSRSRVAQVPLHITRQQIDTLEHNIQSGLQRCIALIDQMVAALQRVQDDVEDHINHLLALIRKGPETYKQAGELKAPWGDAEPWLADGQIALLQADLDEEPVWQQVLLPMIAARHKYLQRTYEEFVLGAGKREALQTQRRLSVEQANWLFIQEAARENLRLLEKEIR